MMSKNIGDYVFPRPLPTGEFPPEECLQILKAYSGMTLHDYASLSILQGLMANPARYEYISDLVERGCSQEEATLKNIQKANRIADAWIAERNKP
jgi:hypothetical protein